MSLPITAYDLCGFTFELAVGEDFIRPGLDLSDRLHEVLRHFARDRIPPPPPRHPRVHRPSIPELPRVPTDRDFQDRGMVVTNQQIGALQLVWRTGRDTDFFWIEQISALVDPAKGVDGSVKLL